LPLSRRRADQTLAEGTPDAAAARALERAREARALPFVFVFGRDGFALSYYGANVYPENVSPALEHGEVAAHAT
jgi:phenylacetate-coenzyme A ligase PaaK-like adenylate-forming protein